VTDETGQLADPDRGRVVVRSFCQCMTPKRSSVTHSRRALFSRLAWRVTIHVHYLCVTRRLM